MEEESAVGLDLVEHKRLNSSCMIRVGWVEVSPLSGPHPQRFALQQIQNDRHTINQG